MPEDNITTNIPEPQNQQVNEADSVLSPQMPQPKPSRKFNISKKLVAISLVLLLLIGSATANGWYFFKYRRLEVVAKNNTKQLLATKEALRDAQNELDKTLGTSPTSTEDAFQGAYPQLSEEELARKQEARLRKIDSIIKIKIVNQNKDFDRYPCDLYKYNENQHDSNTSTEPTVTELDAYNIMPKYEFADEYSSDGLDINKNYTAPMYVKSIKGNNKLKAMDIINGSIDLKDLGIITDCQQSDDSLKYEIVDEIEDFVYQGTDASRAIIMRENYLANKNDGSRNNRFVVLVVGVKGDDFISSIESIASSYISTSYCNEITDGFCHVNILFPTEYSHLKQVAIGTAEALKQTYKIQ